MTLETLLYNIGEIALKRNLVNAYFAGGSLYELNAEIIREYPVIFLTPAGDHTVKENTTRYSVTIYYVDRLWDDDRNETDIVSAGIETLKNIKRQLPYLDWVAAVQEEPIIRLFTETEKMNDRLAGAYMNIWVEVVNASVCAEFLDELGRPMGNYIPGNLNVLDAYATKAWVILQNYADKPWVLEQIADIHISGGTTPKQVLEMISSALTEYTKTVNFATINNSAITEGGNFELADKDDLAELSGVTAQEIQEIYDAIALLSGATYIEQISAATYNNEENINILSANTENIINDIHNLSAYTSGISESLIELSGATVSGFTDVYSAISANTELIYELSGATASGFSAITEDLAALSAYTSALSSVTYNNEENINIISANTENIINDIHNLSAYTSGISESLIELSGATVSGFSEVHSAISVTEALISGNTQLIVELSGATVSGFSAMTEALEEKQDKLVAGDNILISGNTISALGNDVVYDYDVITGMTNAQRKTWGEEIMALSGQGKRILLKQAVRDGYWWLEMKYGNRAVDYNSALYFFPITLNYSVENSNPNNTNKAYKLTRTSGAWESQGIILPPATTTNRGGVSVGNGLSVTSEGVLSTKLQSDDVAFIWAGTQDAYNAMSAHTPTTLYIIKSL